MDRDVEISNFQAAKLINDVRHQEFRLKCLDSMELAIEFGRPVPNSKYKIAARLQALRVVILPQNMSFNR